MSSPRPRDVLGRAGLVQTGFRMGKETLFWYRVRNKGVDRGMSRKKDRAERYKRDEGTMRPMSAGPCVLTINQLQI